MFLDHRENLWALNGALLESCLLTQLHATVPKLPACCSLESMMLGSKLWSCSDLEKGYHDMMTETPANVADLRRRILDACFHSHTKLANLFLSSSAKMHCASQDLRAQIDASEETQGMDVCFNGSCCNMFMLDEVCTVAREFFLISQG